jgi:CRP/FNR family nitrogen fixation transcriptional regulator
VQAGCVPITDRASRRNTLNDLGLTSGSNPIVCLNEFAYKRGTEIYGENEPADYVYQVKKGAVRSYKLLSDGRRQIGAFHLVGDIFGLTNGENHRHCRSGRRHDSLADETAEP